MSKTLKDCQTEVNAWVGARTPAYWSPHQIYTRLGSEVGELGKEINHEFGPIKKKPDEKPSSVVEECGDIVFTVICLLNSQGLSLDKAFQIAMAKCYGRDKDRFPMAETTRGRIEATSEVAQGACRAAYKKGLIDAAQAVCRYCRESKPTLLPGVISHGGLLCNAVGIIEILEMSGGWEAEWPRASKE